MTSDNLPKWTNNAGPRKSKTALQLLGAILSTRNQTVELWDSGPAVTSAMFTRTPAADAIEDEYRALGDAFGWALTNANLQDFERAAAGTLKKCRDLRPVEDKRRTEEEKKAAADRMAASLEASRERERALEACHAAILAKRPPWARALIVATLQEDKSDAQTDYFGHQDVRHVAIGWRSGEREDFKQMRQAAATFPETAHLGPGRDHWTARVVVGELPAPGYVVTGGQSLHTGTYSHWHNDLYPQSWEPPSFQTEEEARAYIAEKGEPQTIHFGDVAVPFVWALHCESVEHREKYSMGHGYYLSRGGAHASGWKVSAVPLAEKGGVWRIAGQYHYEDALPNTHNGGDDDPSPSPTNPLGGEGSDQDQPQPTAGAAMSLNAEKSGVELRFSDKPSDELREQMKAAGFRCTRRPPWVWYARQRPDTIAFAQSITGGVCARCGAAHPCYACGVVHGVEEDNPNCNPDPSGSPRCDLRAHDGFDSAERWGNSAMPGSGVNSPAMMEERVRLNDMGKRKPEAAEKLRAAADRLQRDIDKPQPYNGMNPTRKRIQAWSQHAKQVMRAEELQRALRTLAQWHESGEWPRWETTRDRSTYLCRMTDDLVRMEQPGLDPSEGQRAVTTECDRQTFDAAIAELRTYRTAEVVAGTLAPWGLDRTPIRAAARWLLLTAPASAPDPERDRRRKIEQAERELLQTKIPGYFPTPPDVARMVVEAADIQPGMRVLEPSAGSGAIADAIKAHAMEHGNVELLCNELSFRLVELLTLKGYLTCDADFMTFGPPPEGESWDRIIMNPPFEDSQDIEHVQHAYKLLKPGGRLVALMSPGGWFRQDKKAQAFRAWLQDIADGDYCDATGRALAGFRADDTERARVYALPEGSFKSSGTGVSVRMLVIDKSGAEDEPSTISPELSHALDRAAAARREAAQRQDAASFLCIDCHGPDGEHTSECSVGQQTSPAADFGGLEALWEALWG
jgi:hypothetical protein